MAARPRFDVFISYSRADTWRVTPLVALLRAAGLIAFRDEDTIKPGVDWRVALDQSIERATRVMVFWSENAADSRNVKREYRKAIRLKKMVVPVLLDSTELTFALQRYQCLDIRAAMASGSERTVQFISSSASRGKVSEATFDKSLVHVSKLLPTSDRVNDWLCGGESRDFGNAIMISADTLPPLFRRTELAEMWKQIASRLEIEDGAELSNALSMADRAEGQE